MGNCCAKQGVTRPKAAERKNNRVVAKEAEGEVKSSLKAKKGALDNVEEGKQGPAKREKDRMPPVEIPRQVEEFEPISPTLFGGAPITPRKHLILAARTGNLATVTTLLEHGTPTETTDNDGRTALSHACIRGDAAMLKLLIHHKASIDTLSKDGWSPLHFAVMEKRHLVAETLIAHGADPNTKSTHGFTPLSLAAMLGIKPMVALLLKNKADRSIPDKYGLTPAQRAARQSQYEIAAILGCEN
eukprot:TRINITY_DN21745_c0_g1_i1.p2 TRINITY_DN21745_c0_g1~~TRINITY_DN21745_c0_g1_i1.p2  ORF type:complete len:257 (+),score=68.51 TRINITY_DN21745_c0_g1_i1:42-773(+)